MGDRIEVKAVCDDHGEVEEGFKVGDLQFCPHCVADLLTNEGVNIIYMVTKESKDDGGVYSYECPACHKLRDSGDTACPHCGVQE